MENKMKWFSEAKYGLFIHWGLYAQLGGEYKGVRTDRIAEWIQNNLNIPVEEYEKIMHEFNPVEFDADKIVKMAKDCGMKYLVFTSKHHEGFAMWDSACSEYKITNTPFKRDVVKELSDACRKYDIHFGLYYSQAQDWHDPDGFMNKRDNSHKNFEAYLNRKCYPQVKELLTNYDNIDLLWFDTPMEMTFEQSQKLVDLVHSLKPECIINGRIGHNLGDYMTTGDNFIPRLSYPGFWEVPATVNDTWGYSKFDAGWKDPKDIIRLLLKIINRNGNYLLNVGPDQLGNVPEKSVEILQKVAEYVNTNAEAIYGSRACPTYPYELDYCEFTVKDKKLYVHMLKPKRRMEIFNFVNKVKKVTLLKDGRELNYNCGFTCEGTPRIEVNFPKEMQTESYYCFCIEYEEKDPVFTPLD